MSDSPQGEWELTTQHKHILRESALDENTPGTILHDFKALMEYLRAEPLTLTNKQRQLPLRSLPEINARLAHPIQLGLKRPVQKSYPHVNGLYLLVRASGLTYVDETVTKPVLLIDPMVDQVWTSLNPSERYGNLLETWLLRGKPEIIGDSRSTFSISRNFRKWKYLHDSIPYGGMQIAGDRDAEASLAYAPEWHNLGLLDLFGLIHVQRGVPEEGNGWRIERVHRTPFGDALYALLYAQFLGGYDRIQQMEAEVQEEGRFGSLQPVLQPYWPTWERNLSIPPWVFREGTHIFKVALGSVWWRIAISARSNLETLSNAILNIIEFTHDHLYQFTYQNRFGAVDAVFHPYMDEKPSAAQVSIGDLPLQVGQMMYYTYDFGDWWEFDVTLERVDDEMQIEAPVVIESHGEPPEQYPRADDWY